MIVFAVMSRLAKVLRCKYPKGRFGIQILAYSDNLAMDIAIRNEFSFIRGESLLFSGLRPEGETPNQGNLARLYTLRNLLFAGTHGAEQNGPKVYVDIHKKHTLFSDKLDALDVWLENLLFLKLEGLVVTGTGTGQPTDAGDIQKALTAVESTFEKAKVFLGKEWQPEVIVGSGVSSNNIFDLKKSVSAVIIGSSLKENGYWECPLDELRLQAFMEKWYAEA